MEKEIKFRVRTRDKYTFDYKNGIILDKYTGTKEVKIDMPSGKGGTTSGEVYINTDYYLVQEEKRLYHVECCDVVEFITKTK